MKFEQLILAAGYTASDFPLLSAKKLILLDEKNRQIEEDLSFKETIFANNPTYTKKFYKFLVYNEKNISLVTKSTEIEGKLTADVLIIYTQRGAEVFFR